MKENAASIYDTDFCEWSKIQSQLLKDGQFSSLDIDNIAEEIESLGRNDKRALLSHLLNLLLHKLKMKFQPEKQEYSNSWENSVCNALRQIEMLIEDSPSLQRHINDNWEKTYQYARKDAARETNLPIEKFPKECPWEIQDLLPYI